MIRWGILSAAKIGIQQEIPALKASENCCVAAIASRSEKKARMVAERFSIPHVFASYKALLDSNKIDAIYIPLPASHHNQMHHRYNLCVQYKRQ